MQTLDRAKQRAAGLYWLAFLLTGRRGPSEDMVVETAAPRDGAIPYFSTWMQSWSRRVAIAKALAAIRGELAASARRTELKRMNKPALPARDWALDPGTTKAELENALLAIDVFPRAALLLSVFEGVPIEDAVVLLDAHPALVKKARTIGLRELTGNLARMQGWTPTAARPSVVHSETQYA